MTQPQFIPLSSYRENPVDQMEQLAADFYGEIRRRRTVREFSDREVPRQVIENCLMAAGTAPSGANLQPWHFVVVSDSDVKKQIREAAEEEEREFYHHKAPQEWLDALAPLGTDEHKPFLETAPYLIAIFAQRGQFHDHVHVEAVIHVRSRQGGSPRDPKAGLPASICVIGRRRALS